MPVQKPRVKSFTPFTFVHAKDMDLYDHLSFLKILLMWFPSVILHLMLASLKKSIFIC